MTNEMTMEQATERVARGMAWIMEHAVMLDLDLNRVNLDTVNVVNDHNCVLAQAGGRDFWEVLSDVEDTPDDDEGRSWTVVHGFATSVAWITDPEVLQRQATLLAAAWRSAIQAERTTDTAS